MIKNFIFDLGNVVFDFNPEKILEKCIPFSKGSFDFEILKEYIFGDKVLLWEAGSISTDEIKRLTCNDLIGIDKSYLVPYCLDVFDSWYEMLEIDYKMLKLIEKLRLKGYKCFALSNVSEDFRSIEEKILKYFYGAMLSYDRGLLKPAFGIYKYLLHVYDLKPEECFFIDNKEENVLAAKKLNIDCYVFAGYSDLVSRLNQMDILI